MAYVCEYSEAQLLCEPEAMEISDPVGSSSATTMLVPTPTAVAPAVAPVEVPNEPPACPPMVVPVESIAEALASINMEQNNKSAERSQNSVDRTPLENPGSTTPQLVQRQPLDTAKFCSLCKKSHPLRACNKFKKMPHDKRLRHVLRHGHCSRCLSQSHIYKDCRSKAKCTKCQRDHNTWLHSPNVTDEKNRSVNTSRSRSFGHTVSSLPLRHVVNFSPTLQVKLLIGNRGIQVRAALDLCCSISYISDSLVKELKIAVSRVDGFEICRVVVGSIYDPYKQLHVTAKVSKMSGIKTPLEDVNANVRDQFLGFQLADPTFFKSGQVALVLGPELSSQILTGRIYANQGCPLAQHTIFGWVISGQSGY